MKTVLVIVALFVFAAATQDLEELQEFSKPSVWCGRRLSHAVATACSLYELSKKSDPGFGYQYQLPWLRQDLEKSRGKRQGIVDECCNRPCSLETLLSYC